MKHGGRGAALLLLVVAAATACSDRPEPTVLGAPESSVVATEYDPSLEPSAAVLPLVPADATTLAVTDFEQLRLTLGFGDFDSTAEADVRARFWSSVASSAALSEGLLRPVDAQLREQFGFGQDDVSWEATYTGGDGDGWVVAFRESLPMAAVQRAMRAGVGPLAGAVLDEQRGLLTSAPVPEPDESWAAESDIAPLVGQQANATYVERGCVPFDSVYGEGMEASLATAPAAALEELDPLAAYSIAFGSDLATVRLGEDRPDAFARLRLDQVMPQLEPEFGTVFARGVADPSGGRLGFDLARPAVAAELTLERRLPFAICAPD